MAIRAGRDDVDRQALALEDLKHGAASGAELKGVQVQAVDSTTLELKLPNVLPHIFSLVADVMVVDPQSDSTSDVELELWDSDATGTGAFELDALTPGVEMRLVDDPRAWARAAAAWSACPAMTVQEAIAYASDTSVPAARALPVEELIAYASDTSVSPAARKMPTALAAALHQLTQGEREVVSLVSAGLTDYEIAAALSISANVAHARVEALQAADGDPLRATELFMRWGAQTWPCGPQVMDDPKVIAVIRQHMQTTRWLAITPALVAEGFQAEDAEQA